MDLFGSCPLCNRILPQSELQRHANTHFEEEEDEQFNRDLELAQQLVLEESSSFTTTATATTTTTTTSSDEKVSCLIALQVRCSFHEVKVESGGGLMALLRKCLELDTKNTSPGASTTVLLSGYVDHYQTMTSEDVGWGCGWRNIQMLSSHLLSSRQDAVRVLFGGSGFVPDIPYLQRWLEIAWDNGFDPFGAHHFNHSLYGSSKWIGTTECAALFRSFGLRARVVDFGPKELESLFLSVPSARIASSQLVMPNAKIKRKAFQVVGAMDRYLTSRNHHVSQPDSSACDNAGSSSNHLGGENNQTMEDNLLRNNKHPQVLDWVWNYFSDGSIAVSACCSRVIATDKAPLYFQHDGHSRTIVGIEVSHQQNGKQHCNLLILDPGHRTAALEESLKENVGWKKLIKRGVHTLRKSQYQLCYVDPGLASRDEMEKLKTMDSTFIEF